MLIYTEKTVDHFFLWQIIMNIPLSPLMSPSSSENNKLPKSQNITTEEKIVIVPTSSSLQKKIVTPKSLVSTSSQTYPQDVLDYFLKDMKRLKICKETENTKRGVGGNPISNLLRAPLCRKIARGWGSTLAETICFCFDEAKKQDFQEEIEAFFELLKEENSALALQISEIHEELFFSRMMATPYTSHG